MAATSLLGCDWQRGAQTGRPRLSAPEGAGAQTPALAEAPLNHRQRWTGAGRTEATPVGQEGDGALRSQEEAAFHPDSSVRSEDQGRPTQQAAAFSRGPFRPGPGTRHMLPGAGGYSSGATCLRRELWRLRSASPTTYRCPLALPPARPGASRGPWGQAAAEDPSASWATLTANPE